MNVRPPASLLAAASASEQVEAICRPRRAKREYASGQDGLHTWPEDEQRSPKGKKALDAMLGSQLPRVSVVVSEQSAPEGVAFDAEVPSVKSCPELASVGCAGYCEGIDELFALFSDARATASLRIREGQPGYATKRSASWIHLEHHCYKLRARGSTL